MMTFLFIVWLNYVKFVHDDDNLNRAKFKDIASSMFTLQIRELTFKKIENVEISLFQITVNPEIIFRKIQE